MAVFKDHFSSHAQGYAASRPTYPKSLIDFLASVAPGRRLALDCACGGGQLSIPLASRFERVVATDASAQQIAYATIHDRVEYKVGVAEQSGLPPASVDLITVAQAAHWLDLDAFYAECRRVARPEAVVALISYGILNVDGDEVEAAIQHLYHEVLSPHWPPERRHVEAGYGTLPFPFEELLGPSHSMQVSWNLLQLAGYIETWSALRQAEQSVGREPVDAALMQLAKAWGDPEFRRIVRWPLVVRAGCV